MPAQASGESAGFFSWKRRKADAAPIFSSRRCGPGVPGAVDPTCFKAEDGGQKIYSKIYFYAIQSASTDSRTAPLRSELEPDPLPKVAGGFSTILADPPWRFTNRTGKVAPEHRRLDRYSTMSMDAIKGLHVSKTAAEECASVSLGAERAADRRSRRHARLGVFRYVSNIVWAKRRKDGGPDGRGVGFYFRNVTELLLFGVKGSMRTLAPGRSQVNMIETRKRGTLPGSRMSNTTSSRHARPVHTWNSSRATRARVGQYGETSRQKRRRHAGKRTRDTRVALCSRRFRRTRTSTEKLPRLWHRK